MAMSVSLAPLRLDDDPAIGCEFRSKIPFIVAGKLWWTNKEIGGITIVSFSVEYPINLAAMRRARVTTFGQRCEPSGQRCA